MATSPSPPEAGVVPAGTIVVKLGGSLAGCRAAQASLRFWLDLLTRHGGGRVVAVAGGGAFADTVRAAQAEHRFSDRAAHRMALLAMEQYAIMLADLAPILTACADPAAMGRVLAAGGIPVWLPSRMALADPAIAESWDVTSDSLAAWLARRIAARALVLVKSAAAPRAGSGPAAWAASGLVDAAFPAFTREAPFAILCLGPDDERAFAAVLAAGE